MFKIYLAVGHKDLESFLRKNAPLIESQLKQEVCFVGTAVYKEGIIQGIKDYHPDVILIREGLPGSLKLTDLVYQIKIISDSTRIIFLAGDRKPGDAFLATLVQYGVYDILVGTKVNAKEMIKKIIHPNKLADVAEFMPKLSIDEKTGKQLYEAPDIGLMRTPLLDENIPVGVLGEVIPEDDEILDIEDDTPDVKDDYTTIEDDTPIIEDDTPNFINPVDSNYQQESPIVQIEQPTRENPFRKNNNMDKTPKKTGFFGKGNKELNLDNSVPLTKSEPEPITPLQLQIDKEPETYNPTYEPSNYKTETTPIIVPVDKEPIVQQKTVQQVVQPNPIVIPIVKEEVPQTIIEQQPIQVETPKEQVPNYPPNSGYYPPNGYQPGYPPNNGYYPPNGYQPGYPPNNQNNQPEKKKGLFGKKQQKTVSQQIVTFLGGRHGCGTSTIAFNVALSLAEQNYKVLYLDIDDTFSSNDAIFAFGFQDLGVDTMLRAIEENNYQNIPIAINSASKILSNGYDTDSKNKTFGKFPTKFEFACFSTDALYKENKLPYNPNNLKDLIMFLSMNLAYDMIIIDAPSDYKNELTKNALVYSNKIFFTITQDLVDVSCLVANLRQQVFKNMGYQEKANFIFNKFTGNNSNMSNLGNIIMNNLRISEFTMSTIPNVYIDAVNASNDAIPLLWKCKDKNFKKGIQEISSIILN